MPNKTITKQKAMKIKAIIKELEQDLKDMENFAAKIRKNIHDVKPQENQRMLEELEVPPLELLEDFGKKKR